MVDDDYRRAEFGPNQWLIDELYRSFLVQPESVSEGWREFFADYRPTAGTLPPPRATPLSPPVAAQVPTTAPAATVAPAVPGPSSAAEPLLGPARRLAENMAASLQVPTATTVRTLPVKLLEENRTLLNHHLAEERGGKVSYTHLIAWALVKALEAVPAMRAVFVEIGGAPHKEVASHVNLGLAVDVQRKDGNRGLLVPNIKGAEALDFAHFFATYNELLRKAQHGQLSPDDFAGTTASFTNPGMLGTTQSVPRLMAGQSLIVAAGSIGYPAEYQLADERALARLGVSKVMTLTCTYDHRVIQGAESAAFLQLVAELLAGKRRFYDELFASFEIPHEPMRLAPDSNPYFSERGADALIEKQVAVMQLINMYRVRGHLVAHLNPLGSGVPTHPELELARYGLTLWDLDREFCAGNLGGNAKATLRAILDTLRTAYCGTMAVEYMHIQEADQKAWIQGRIEGMEPSKWVDGAGKRRILAALNRAEAFERFLHTRYVGHKRFSLEGVESLIPTLEHLLERARAAGVEEAVIGMAHRGRLNVLANILGKSYDKIFRSFEGSIDPASREGTGDVKYHLGAKGRLETPAGTLQLTLASNPSHLEAVDPVVEGLARALQDLRGDITRARVLPILIHGDAAFAGQGVVAETLNMSALAGFRTGGTIHIVVNNGIGFTTAPADARSSVYATDVAKMVQAPIFHVNSDDPEACVRTIELALEFRRAFQKDVVVDMIGYRRWGHNEADEPAYTQPLMYARIAEHRSVRKLYTEKLVNRGDLSLEEADAALGGFQKLLEDAFAATKESAPPEVCLLTEEPPPEPLPPPPPAVPREVLERVLAAATTVPAVFHVHPKLARQLALRAQALALDAVDWGTAELLAFGSLLLEGKPVRLTGQDSRRGTFSHRHAVLVDQQTGADLVPLQHLDPDQAPFALYDSMLSEYAGLGFEYGYSLGRPDALVLWEAQFGDFVNGAQIVIDQLLAAAEEKWDQHSRLGLLLPHGHEGQGPEHSSARLERFLQLCAADNLRVVVPSTAGQYFHLLRSQAHLEHAKPLVVLTPKSLLRLQAARSTAADLCAATFQPVLADPDPPTDPTRLVLGCGKVAHDLLAARAQHAGKRVSIVRVEQLFPFPDVRLGEIVRLLPALTELVWAQEEPRNMGAWSFVAPRLTKLFSGISLRYVGRPSSPSPATGSARVHEAEQERLVTHALQG